MRRALALAKKGEGSVLPNPMVGAVLVKNGKIIAQGYHKKYGGDHAEVMVLNKVTKSQVRGAKLYVTLEPCSHFGKTPPCTNFLISKGVNDIIVAVRDPNPLVAGKGISFLRRHGAKVSVGVLEEEAKMLNRVFFHNMAGHLPWATVKFGLTLDGKIATLDHESKYITGMDSRRMVHELRSKVQAVLTTSETVLHDNPHLGVRLTSGRDPLRVILDPMLRTSLEAEVYRDSNVLVAISTSCSERRKGVFRGAGIRMMAYPGTQIPLKRLLRDLNREGICYIMTEGGSRLATNLFREGLANEIVLFMAPKILGAGIPWIRDLKISHLGKAIRLRNMRASMVGEDILIQADV